jgi:hypothetical protein
MQSGRSILHITPHSCADNFYSEIDGSPSWMSQLSNLVPSISSIDEWVPRPAATLFANSNTKTPGFVSCFTIVGTRVYGLISDNNGTPGYDQPFCYDLLGSAFLPVQGITINNLPVSPPTTGAWQPPHAELVGVYVILTSTGYSGTGSNFFGAINIANPSNLSYNSYQLNVGTGGIVLPSVPVWCSQFNGRAYFLCNPTTAQPAAIFTDANNPLGFYAGTTALYTNALTFGGNFQLTCSGTVAYTNQLGGQTQSLIVFQGANNMQQITGDPSATISISTTSTTTTTTTNPAASGGLAINALNVATGTLAPNTICRTPHGLAFVAPDGLRIIDFSGRVGDPVGYGGQGICLPFFASTTPSRMAAACNATTLRISTINGAVTNTPQQEWCYDIVRKIWHGPHTFPVSLISAYAASFVCTQIGVLGLFSSDIVPNSASSYTENGAPMTCTWQSGYCPDRPSMSQLSSTRAVFYSGYGAGNTVLNISAIDVNNNILTGGFVSLSFAASVTNWGQFAWGHAIWLGSAASISAAQVDWTAPLVFDRVAIQISTTASAGLILGDFMMEIEEEDYTVLST